VVVKESGEYSDFSYEIAGAFAREDSANRCRELIEYEVSLIDGRLPQPCRLRDGYETEVRVQRCALTDDDFPDDAIAMEEKKRHVRARCDASNTQWEQHMVTVLG